jgi:hypothetical protein
MSVSNFAGSRKVVPRQYSLQHTQYDRHQKQRITHEVLGSMEVGLPACDMHAGGKLWNPSMTRSWCCRRCSIFHFRPKEMQVRLQSATSNGCIKLGTAAQEGMRTRREDGRHYQKEREEGGKQGWTDGRREGRLRLADRSEGNLTSLGSSLSSSMTHPEMYSKTSGSNPLRTSSQICRTAASSTPILAERNNRSRSWQHGPALPRYRVLRTEAPVMGEEAVAAPPAFPTLSAD